MLMHIVLRAGSEYNILSQPSRNPTGSHSHAAARSGGTSAGRAQAAAGLLLLLFCYQHLLQGELPGHLRACSLFQSSHVVCTQSGLSTDACPQVDPRNGQWTCIFCGHRNSDHGALSSGVQVPSPFHVRACAQADRAFRRLLRKLTETGVMQACPELRSEAVDYVTPAPEEATPSPPRVALVLDVSPEALNLEALKSSVLQVRLG